MQKEVMAYPQDVYKELYQIFVLVCRWEWMLHMLDHSFRETYYTAIAGERTSLDKIRRSMATFTL